MGSYKCYAVKKEKNAGVYEFWGKSKQAVLGLIGTQYKIFNTQRDAELYLYGDAEEHAQLFNDGISIY